MKSAPTNKTTPFTEARENRFYILYDGRAAGGDTDGACPLDMVGEFSSTTDALRVARQNNVGMEFVMFSYRQDKKDTFTDERYEHYEPTKPVVKTTTLAEDPTFILPMPVASRRPTTVKRR